MPTSTGQPNRIFWILVCALLPLFGSVANLQAQDKPAQHTETLTPRQIMELNEIAALRARMGGGVTERLQGVIPGGNPEQQFHESLKSIAGSQQRAELTLVPLQKPTAPATGETGITSTPWRVRTNPKPSKADSARQVLRSSARMLEELAAELELAQLYDKADELRKTAARYWLQARSMN